MPIQWSMQSLQDARATPSEPDPAPASDGAESLWDAALIHLLAEALAGDRRRALH